MAPITVLPIIQAGQYFNHYGSGKNKLGDAK
jgi:hypothetical protein